jgi:hypothetical protein
MTDTTASAPKFALPDLKRHKLQVADTAKAEAVQEAAPLEEPNSTALKMTSADARAVPSTRVDGI